MGATAGTLGGAALGDALAAHPDNLATALEAYEAKMRPFITKHQRTAGLKSQLFVPTGPVAWWIRRQLLDSKIVRRALARTTKSKSLIATLGSTGA